MQLEQRGKQGLSVHSRVITGRGNSGESCRADASLLHVRLGAFVGRKIMIKFPPPSWHIFRFRSVALGWPDKAQTKTRWGPTGSAAVPDEVACGNRLVDGVGRDDGTRRSRSRLATKTAAATARH
jgi:hypothetical protein